MSGTSRKIFAVLGAVCLAGAYAATAKAAPQNMINISGATLFKHFFTSPASTNDFIDADGNGYSGFHYTEPNVQQLAADFVSPISTWSPYWAVQYRGIGSGNGLKEMVNYYKSAPGMEMVVPSDVCTLNRTQWGTKNGIVYPGNLANPGACPIPPVHMDIATMDVPTKWFVVQGTAEEAAWNRKPLTPGYGQNPAVSDMGQANTLKSLTASDGRYTLNTNTDDPDSQTVYDTPIAWVPSAFIANRGTGLQNIDVSNLQYIYVTGRTRTGENIVAATRDAGSGTRNGVMNSIGIDPSWGVGDNTGSKSSDGTVAYLGPNHRDCNLDGTSIEAAEVKNHRLAIGYVGLDTAASDCDGGQYEILNVRKDIAGGVEYVRPSVDAVLFNSDVDTGWQIGGQETMATVGDPEAPTSGNAAMLNPAAAAYIRNITHSIAAFSGDPSSNESFNMPGEYMASQFFLQGALDAVPQTYPTTDPTVFVVNTAKNPILQSYSAMLSALYVPDFGSVNAAGLVPNRTALTGGETYSDGRSDGAYVDSFGNVYTAGLRLAQRNAIAGDFNYDNHRDWNDIAKMMEAINDPTGFEANHDWGGNRGDQLHDAVIVSLIGDFNGDGNFDSDDVRYFADGLAVDPITGDLNRKEGFTRVDEASQALGGPLNYFGTSLCTGKPYAAGASMGDMTGNPATVHNTPGAKPTADGTVNVYDLRYIKANFGDWSDLDSASTIDLSCDMNGDLVIDANDVAAFMEQCLGSGAGDIDLDGYVNVGDLQVLVAAWGTDSNGSGFNSEADINGDTYVNVGDLQALVATWGMGS